jgi:aldose 1-epimerase
MQYRLALTLIIAVAGILTSCMSEQTQQQFSARTLDIEIGGQPVVTLERQPPEDQSRPQLLKAVLLPGRGMNTYQLQAYLPGKGVVDLFTAPSLEEAQKIMDGGPEDFYGSKSFTVGGAILVPFANRIRGKLIESERALETTVGGKTVKMPANWQGKKPGAERHAIHGLILDQGFRDIALDSAGEQASVSGTLNAGDFRGHWPSQTQLDFTATLRDDSFEFSVLASNTGAEPAPIGIGWHPYCELPSGKRAQARLHVPARRRALVNNYDDVFPTGELVEVKDTPYDFSSPDGAALVELFLDDCYVDLQKNANGETVSVIVDPEARYGLRIIAASKEVSAIQVYAPVTASFIAVEPQFNWAEPFSSIWKGADTGMVTLAPGESVTYTIRLELFVP